MNQLIKTFCEIDDYCKEYELECKNLLEDHEYKEEVPSTSMSLSEIMNILINFHQSKHLSYDIYDKKQMEAVQLKSESLAEAYKKVKNNNDLTESEKELIKSEVYSFFEAVFGEDKAFDVLGETPNLTECVVASAEFMKQSSEITNTITGAAAFAGNRKMKRAIVNKRK